MAVNVLLDMGLTNICRTQGTAFLGGEESYYFTRDTVNLG